MPVAPEDGDDPKDPVEEDIICDEEEVELDIAGDECDECACDECDDVFADMDCCMEEGGEDIDSRMVDE